MKVIVTGGAGFIGSHLVDRLLTDGHEVLALDNFATGRPDNLANASKHASFSLYNADIVDLENIAPLFKGVEWVFHLGALADIVLSVTDPMKYHKANVDGTIAVLEASRRANVRRFVYAASSSCYGLPDIFPTPESSDIRPMYPYALTKNVGEQYVMHWDNVYGLPTIALRLFNVYGPRSRASGTYGAVFGVFLAQKLAGEPFTVVGDGEQTRDFVYVSDVTDAFVKAAECNLHGQSMNVGSGNTRSINTLVELLGGESVHIKKRPGEPDCTFADITKLTKETGWIPNVSLEDGVKVMLDHIQEWRNAPLWNKDSIAYATREWFDYLGRNEEVASPIKSAEGQNE